MYGIGNIQPSVNNLLTTPQSYEYGTGLGRVLPKETPAYTYKQRLKYMGRRFNQWGRNQVSWGKFIEKIKPFIDPEKLLESEYFTVLIIEYTRNTKKQFKNIAQALDYAFENGFQRKHDFYIFNEWEQPVLIASSIEPERGYISKALFGIPCGLGKPTIKLEFNDNSELADFLKDTKKAAQFADYIDVTETSTATDRTSPQYTIRNGILMPGSTDKYLPTSAQPSPTTPTNTPPTLPPSPTSTAKALPPYVEPKTKPTNTQSGNSPLMRHYNEIKSKYPDAVILFKVGDFYEAFGDDADIVAITLNLNLVKRGEDKFTGFPVNSLDQNLPRLVRAGIKTVIAEQLEDASKTQKTTKEPTSTQSDETPEGTPEITAESVTDEEIEAANVSPVTLDWDDFEKRFAKASNWSSFDPERSARFHINGYKEAYEKYVSQVPAQYRNSFDWFVKRYINDLIAKRSRTASSAVTGPGGIDAKKAASLNRANDRFQEASVNLPYTLAKYVHKINLREKRKAFVNSSLDERYAQRIKELKNEITTIALTKEAQSKIANGGEIPEDIAREFWYLNKDSNIDDKKLREKIVKALNGGLNQAKATFKDKLTREVTKGNVEIVDAIIDYLKPLGLFTNRAEIWTFPELARRKRQTFETATQQAAESAADENSNYRIEYDTQEDRVKIIFKGMPSVQAREWLKKYGFRWSPRNKAWQRQITDNARRAVEQFKASGLGKPTIKFEFEDNAELLSLFDTDGISGMTVNDKPAAVFNCPESQLQTQGYRPTYTRLSDYSHLIDAADGAKTLKGYGFETSTLDELVNACKNYKQVERLAAHLYDKDKTQAAFNIWHWLHTNIRYNYDTPGQEEIRTPARVWADRYSGVDCDCLAVMTACLLINQGFHPCFEIVAFNNCPTYSHIYVNLDGMAIDRVLPVFLARPEGITKTKIMDIPVYQLSGIGGCGDTLDGVYAATLRKINDRTATGEDNLDFRKTQVLVTLRGVDESAYKLAALLMPYIVTIGDDGAYYFANSKMASLAAKLDNDLQQLIEQDADADTIDQWLANVAAQIDTASADTTATSGRETIVVIINPVGDMTKIVADMVKADTPTLTETSKDAINQGYTAATEMPAIMQTSATPSATLDGEGETSNAAWWIAGIAAAFGFGAAVASGNKKKRR